MHRSLTLLAALTVIACSGRAADPPAAPAPPQPPTSVEAPPDPPVASEAPPTTVSPPVVLGCTMPEGTVVFAHDQRTVFVGITSDVTWLAIPDDAPNSGAWMLECTGIGGVTFHGPHDLGSPQDGVPEWATSVISLTRDEPGVERCLPCYDPEGQRAATVLPGCEC